MLSYRNITIKKKIELKRTTKNYKRKCFTNQCHTKNKRLSYNSNSLIALKIATLYKWLNVKEKANFWVLIFFKKHSHK